jgi:acetyl esterase/lipase
VIRKLNIVPALIACIGLGSAGFDAAETRERLSLWPNGAPGSEARRKEPEVAKDYWVRNIHDPSIEVFLPPADSATGAGVVVVPGGGHRLLVYNAEGQEPAEFLNSLGVAAFALKHRLAREEGSTYSIERDAKADAYRALRLVRSRAQDWHLDPNRIGIMGFSAGGEVVGWWRMATATAMRRRRTRSIASTAGPTSRFSFIRDRSPCRHRFRRPRRRRFCSPRPTIHVARRQP